MKITDPSFEIIDPLDTMPKAQKIELVGRSCYRSEDRITSTSADSFVRGLIAHQHHAMLEHASLIMEASAVAFRHICFLCMEYEQTTQTPSFIRRTFCIQTGRYVLSSNVRAWRNLVLYSSGYTFPEGFDAILSAHPVLFDDLPTVHTAKCFGTVKSLSASDLVSVQERRAHYPLTVQFTVDIAVARELCRHRLASHAGSSTRYCDYAKGKFGSEITVVSPEPVIQEDFVRAARYAEEKYMAQRRDGTPPEIARSCLTLSTMCQHTMTATLGQWKSIFDLRALDKTGKAHPQMKAVMVPLYETCVELFENVFKE